MGGEGVLEKSMASTANYQQPTTTGSCDVKMLLHLMDVAAQSNIFSGDVRPGISFKEIVELKLLMVTL